MKKKKLLATKVDDFKLKLQQFKAGNLSEQDFCNLLIDEITYLKINVLKRYETELANDRKEIEILSIIKHKIKNNIRLEANEKEIVLTIIG